MKVKPHLLIIDDDPPLRDTLKSILEWHGYAVSLAGTGAEALQFISSNQPDLAFVDMMLPDTWGTELIRDIKKNHPRLLCVMITGDTSTDSVIDALHQGADAYFQKPFNMEILLPKIESLLEKKRLREEIRHLNELPRIILDGINESIAIIDIQNFSIVTANKVFIRETGLPENEVNGKPCYSVTHHLTAPCEAPEHTCPIREILATGSHAAAEHVHYDSRGKKSYVEISASPIKDETGHIVQVIHVSRDITSKKELEISLQNERLLLEKTNTQLEQAYNELKQTQSQIVQQEKMASIGQLAAGVAHEINNPMGFISSNLASLDNYLGKLTHFITFQDSLITGLQDEQALRELQDNRKKLKIDYLLQDIPALIAESLDGAERVKIIVQNLKNFSRVEGNEICLTNINDCLETTMNIIHNELKYKAEISREYGENLPQVKASPQQLNQVFMNILVNAAQAIEKKGKITIRTWREKSSVRVAISDTGCGITQQNLSRIFDPFFTTKEVGKGTGLGMSITYDIIKKHNGTISVASEVGRGTTFTVSLPVAEQAAECP
ncbi:MAG: response regulator [Proteobacteria bacterium]|nr:response regulator [Pseudomonadota bacterium]MBU4296016.1 response regulator [Pseudomonadota bacterium]MCG2747266.1 response regulator [Desulfobulbaceae bacterium]